MTTVAIGLGKANDWSKGALSGLQNTNITTPDAYDGWLVLAFATPTTAAEWTALTGWTQYKGAGATLEINPSGVLHMVSGSAEVDCIRNSYWGGGSDSNKAGTILDLMKHASLSTSTNTAAQRGFYGRDEFSNRTHCWNVRSDGTNFDIYHIGASYTKHDTSVPVDSRYHIMGFQNNNADNADEFIIDGIIQYTNGETSGLGGGAGYAVRAGQNYAGSANETYNAYSYYWNTITPWTTTDATWTSTYNDSIFDAGAGNQWKKIDWTAITNNSTGCVVKCRCAATAAGLSSASYETLTSGTDIVTKGQFIQIEVTMSDGSSGRYTPVLKDMTLTNETAALFIPQILCLN